MHIDIPGVDVRANDKGLKERLRFQANISILLSQPVAADPMPSGSISSVEASGVLSPEEPANRAAPQPPKRRKLLKSSGQTKEIRTSHFFLQEAITSAATIPFSFRIGLWPIGFRRVLDERKVAAASGKDVLGRTDPPGPLLALES
jgi:hypothetical protein